MAYAGSSEDLRSPSGLTIEEKFKLRAERQAAALRVGVLIVPRVRRFLRHISARKALGDNPEVTMWQSKFIYALRRTRALCGWPHHALQKLADAALRVVALPKQWIIYPGEDGLGGLTVILAGSAELCQAPVRDAQGRGLCAMDSCQWSTVRAPAVCGSSGIFREPILEAARAATPCVMRTVPLRCVREVERALSPAEASTAARAHAAALVKELTQQPCPHELALLPAFARVPFEYLRALAYGMCVQLRPPGQILQLEGTEVAAIAVLASGRVRVCTDYIGPKEAPGYGPQGWHLTTELAPLAVSVAEAAAGEPHADTLQAETFCELWVAHWPTVYPFLAPHLRMISANCRSTLGVRLQVLSRAAESTQLQPGAPEAAEALGAALGGIPLVQDILSALSPSAAAAAWKSIARRATYNGYLAGEVVARQGHPCENLWVCLRGCVALRTMQKGVPEFGAVVECGEWHGFTCFLTHSWRHTVAALQNTTVAAISRQTLLEWLQEFPAHHRLVDRLVVATHALMHPSETEKDSPAGLADRLVVLYPTALDPDAPSSGFTVHQSVPCTRPQAPQGGKTLKRAVQVTQATGQLRRVLGGTLRGSPFARSAKMLASAAGPTTAGDEYVAAGSAPTTLGPDDSPFGSRAMTAAADPSPRARHGEDFPPAAAFGRALRSLFESTPDLGPVPETTRVRTPSNSQSQSQSQSQISLPLSASRTATAQRGAPLASSATEPEPQAAPNPGLMTDEELDAALRRVRHQPTSPGAAPQRGFFAGRPGAGGALATSRSSAPSELGADSPKAAAPAAPECPDDYVYFEPSEELEELQEQLHRSVQRHDRQLSRFAQDMGTAIRHLTANVPELATNLPLHARKRAGPVDMYHVVPPPRSWGGVDGGSVGAAVAALRRRRKAAAERAASGQGRAESLCGPAEPGSPPRQALERQLQGRGRALLRAELLRLSASPPPLRHGTPPGPPLETPQACPAVPARSSGTPGSTHSGGALPRPVPSPPAPAAPVRPPGRRRGSPHGDSDGVRGNKQPQQREARAPRPPPPPLGKTAAEVSARLQVRVPLSLRQRFGQVLEEARRKATPRLPVYSPVPYLRPASCPVTL